MELKDFVRTALIEICEGVTEARDQVAAKVAIAPGMLHPGKSREKSLDEAYPVNFDVQISLEDNETKDKGGQGKIFVVSAEIGSAQEAKSKLTHHISFSVPVYFNAHFIHARENHDPNHP